MVFTAFWKDEAEKARRASCIQNAEHCKRMSAGEEICKKTGRPHFQGCCVWSNDISFKTAWRRLGGQCHTEAMEKPWLANVRYTQKDKNVVAYWDHSEQGARNDLTPCTDLLVSGKRLRDVAEQHPMQFVKHFKGFQALQAILREPRSTKPHVVCYFGNTGDGKSHAAHHRSPELLSYEWQPQLMQWFDGYDGHKKVIFEEFRGQLPFGMLLSLTDRWPCKVQYKGGITEFVPDLIIFTSPKHPMEWYQSVANDRADQLMRRFDEIHDLTGCRQLRELALPALPSSEFPSAPPEE